MTGNNKCNEDKTLTFTTCEDAIRVGGPLPNPEKPLSLRVNDTIEYCSLSQYIADGVIGDNNWCEPPLYGTKGSCFKFLPSNVRVTNSEAQLKCIRDEGMRLWDHLDQADMIIKIRHTHQSYFDLTWGRIMFHTGVYYDPDENRFYNQTGYGS